MWNLLTNWKTFGALIVFALLVITHTLAYRSGAASRDAEIAKMEAARAMEKAAYAAAALTAQQELDKQAAATRAAVAAADTKANKEIANAKRKLEADRAALASGALGVRLNGAECALAGGGAVPDPSAPASGVDAAAGGLPRSVAENVLDLRASIEHDAAVIRGLQDYARAVSAPANQPMSADGNAGNTE